MKSSEYEVLIASKEEQLLIIQGKNKQYNLKATEDRNGIVLTIENVIDNVYVDTYVDYINCYDYETGTRQDISVREALKNYADSRELKDLVHDIEEVLIYG